MCCHPYVTSSSFQLDNTIIVKRPENNSLGQASQGHLILFKHLTLKCQKTDEKVISAQFYLENNKRCMWLKNSEKICFLIESQMSTKSHFLLKIESSLLSVSFNRTKFTLLASFNFRQSKPTLTQATKRHYTLIQLKQNGVGMGSFKMH